MRIASLKMLVAVGACLLLVPPVLAQTGPELMLKPFPKELTLDLDANLLLTDTGHSKQTNDSIRIGILESAGRYRLNPGDEASPRLGYNLKFFDIDSSMPGMPDHFYDQSIGFAMPVGKYQDWIFGLSVGVGYAGQSPFGDGNGWYGQASAVAFKQLDETTALAIILDYNGNRTYKPDCPLPGFAYIKRIRENLTMTVGLPVTSIEWEPMENLRLSANYVLLDNFGARAGYEFTKGWEVFGALSQRTDTFFFDEQRYGDDRLIFQQRQAELGITYRSGKGGVGEREVEFTAAVGYTFSRELSVGFDSANSRLIADVSDEPYVRLGLTVRY
jgi:hypothetical protein